MRSLPMLSVMFLTSVTISAGNFQESDFTAVNPLDSTLLNGTVSYPAENKPKAVIVLATGSGLQDRDETVGRHKPFKEISDYLASNGYAVVRTDDRGYGNPPDTALLARSTQWDELADYRTIIKSMSSRYENIPIGMLGHSLGGSEAIMNFSKSEMAQKYNSVGRSPDFIITLAAPAVAGDSIILDQTRQLLKLQGADYAFPQLEPKLARRYAWAKSYLPASGLRKALYDDIMEEIPPGTPMTPEMTSLIDSQIEVFYSPAYREMLRYDPTEDMRGISVPWLALYGSKDIQVSVPLNSNAVERATNGKNNVTLTVLEDKNHLFQNARTGSLDEYQAISGAISDDTLQEILEWLETKIVPNNKLK